jgi:predicted aldo/keto reductase-like oxidoreductase
MAQDYASYIARADAFKEEYGIQSEAEARAAATRFTLNNPDVHSVCPTINTIDALGAFVRLSGQRLSADDGAMLDGYDSMLGQYYCRHACGICEPHCPHQVPVNRIMRYSHYFEAHGREKQAMQKYASLDAANANRCLDCPGHCESACPYEVPVRSLLANAHRSLTLA